MRTINWKAVIVTLAIFIVVAAWAYSILALTQQGKELEAGLITAIPISIAMFIIIYKTLEQEL